MAKNYEFDDLGGRVRLISKELYDLSYASKDISGIDLSELSALIDVVEDTIADIVNTLYAEDEEEDEELN